MALHVLSLRLFLLLHAPSVFLIGLWGYWADVTAVSIMNPLTVCA